MAFLDRHENTEDWLKWAIEFVRRGLWPSHVIEVYGPHGPHADLMWGEAEASVDGEYPACFDLEVVFKTASGIGGIHDVRGVRIEAKDEGYEGKRKLT